MAWTTTAAAKAVTKADLTDADLGVAAAVIELHAGRFQDDPMLPRDARWLALAVAYQAAWLLDQPDYLERRLNASESVDGQSVTAFNPDTVTLAPLARKALRRLSYRGNRSVVLRRADERTDEDADDALDWRPM